MKTKTKSEILEKRREIEAELSAFLKETKSDFTLDDIKEAIYEEEETDDFTHLVAMFDVGQGMEELNNILETVSDAWNYFPHNSLNGLSPAEMLSGENDT
ncbi:MAG: hypothetical protein AAB927_02370 [Patescibacteria group bacterium]